MLSEILEYLAFGFLLLQRWRGLKRQGLSSINKPLQLKQEYINHYGRNPKHIYTLVESITRKDNRKLASGLIESTEYKEFMTRIDKSLTIFNNRPYQCGALDLEIDVVVVTLLQFAEPDVLEVGVANGYSSAFLYYVLSKIGGTVTSIDFPRFSTSLDHPTDRIREWLCKRGKVKNTGTLGDLNPGGIVPIEKYAGWLIPVDLRRRVRNVMFCGDAFQILNELKETKFDFVVLDAMKGYSARTRIMHMILERLRPGGVCFVDGYWVNSAFSDFCEEYCLPFWHVGRVGILCNRSAVAGDRTVANS